MKNILYKMMMAIAALVLVTGCQKEEERVKEMLVGDWHYAAIDQNENIDIWVSFSADGTFDMYQKIGSGAYWHSAGKYKVNTDEKLLTGVYSDKTPWKYDYRYSVSDSKLVMTAVQLESYSVAYSKGIIPAEVIEKCLELTKASEGYVPFL